LFCESSEELDRMRWFSQEMFFPRFDRDRARIVDDQGVPGRPEAARTRS